MLTEKRCPKCDTVKPVVSFYKAPQRADGLSSYCRHCQVAATKSRYSPHPRWRAPEGQKWCPRCESIKPIDEFGNNRTSHDGKQTVCKPCSVAAVTASRRKDPTSHRRSSKAWREANPERHADNNARWRYGVEHGTYARLLAEQGGKCAICRGDELSQGTRRFHIDHCHDTGVVRGLLCGRCNTGIGQFLHDPRRLKAAISYLEVTASIVK